MKTFKINESVTFATKASDHWQHNGKKGVIQKVFDKPDEHHDEEVLPMYDVLLTSGEVIHVFHDEITID